MLADIERQFRVLFALVIAESLTRFARRSLGVVEELGGIVIHVFAFSVLRLATGSGTHRGLPEIAFLTSGVFLYWVFKSTITPVSNFDIAKSRHPALPRVTQLDVLIARAIVNAAIYISLAMITFTVFYLMGFANWMYRVDFVLLTLCVSALWGFGVGLIFGAAFSYVPVLRTLMPGFMRMAMYTSGIFYLWPEVPYQFRSIAVWNPFFHLAEFLRSAYFESYRSPIADWRYVGTCVILTQVVGLMSERACRSLHQRDKRKIRDDEEYSFDAI